MLGLGGPKSGNASKPDRPNRWANGGDDLKKQLAEANKEIEALRKGKSPAAQSKSAEVSGDNTKPPKQNIAVLQSTFENAQKTGDKEIMEFIQNKLEAAKSAAEPQEGHAALRVCMGKLSAAKSRSAQLTENIIAQRKKLAETEAKAKEATLLEVTLEAQQAELMRKQGICKDVPHFLQPPPNLKQEDKQKWNGLLDAAFASLKDQLATAFPDMAVGMAVPMDVQDELELSRGAKSQRGTLGQPVLTKNDQSPPCGEGCVANGRNLCTTLCPHGQAAEPRNDGGGRSSTTAQASTAAAEADEEKPNAEENERRKQMERRAEELLQSRLAQQQAECAMEVDGERMAAEAAAAEAK
jgi:hypothetical protein